VDELVVGLTNTCCVVVRVVNFTAAGAKYRSATEDTERCGADQYKQLSAHTFF